MQTLTHAESFCIKDRLQQALTMIENRTFSIMANCEDGLFLFLAVVSLMFCEIFHFEKENIDRWIRCSNSVVRIYRSQLNHHKPQITTDTHHFQLFPNKYWRFQHLFILTEIIEFPNTQTPAHTHTRTHTRTPILSGRYAAGTFRFIAPRRSIVFLRLVFIWPQSKNKPRTGRWNRSVDRWTWSCQRNWEQNSEFLVM